MSDHLSGCPLVAKIVVESSETSWNKSCASDSSAVCYSTVSSVGLLMLSNIRTSFFEYSIREGSLHDGLAVCLDTHGRSLPLSLPTRYNY